MTPAEVIAMRRNLAMEIKKNIGIPAADDLYFATATALIEKGWVVAPPKNEGENDD